MRFTIDDLMQAVHCIKFPQRWRDIYDEAMEDFYANGCAMLQPAYYDELYRRYGVLEKHREVYKEAAKKIGQSEPLSVFLALLCFAIRDREHAARDIGELVGLKSPDGNSRIEYDMLPALAICSLIPYCHEKLRSRNLPEDIIADVMKMPEGGVDDYLKRNGGVYGYSLMLLGWNQLAIDNKLFNIGRLQIEIFSTFWASAIVFKSKNGEYIALADQLILHKEGFPLGAKYYEENCDCWEATISETAEHWFGYPYNKKGFVEKKSITLSKGEWEKVLSPGDSVVSLHIPPGGSFGEEIINDTLKQTETFIKTYFPDFDYKAFVCYSWLLDPQLEELLGENSNIVKFGKKFHRMGAKSNALDVFYFVFGMPTDNDMPVISELPGNTKLEKMIKEHYLNKKAIYEMHGYFFPTETTN